MMARAALQAGALVDGAGVRAMAGVSEMPGTGAEMLRSLLGHELVASHALMMQLTAKTPQFLDLIAAERTPEEQDRGCRQTVQLTAAIARLTDRYRLGLMGLARLEQQTAKEGRRRAADLAGGPDEDGPEDDGPGGGSRRDLARLLAAMAAESRSAAHELEKIKSDVPGGAAGPRGRLRHGNPSGDFAKAPRCGAKTRVGHPCGQPAMANGRCRMHGGCSTGARTAAGLARCRAARLVHGCRTAEIIDLRSAAARHGRTLRTLTRAANAMSKPRSERPTPCQAKAVARVRASGARPFPIPSPEHQRSRNAEGRAPLAPATARSDRPSFARRSGLREGGSTPCQASLRRNSPRLRRRA
jgi:hypothetical protein